MKKIIVGVGILLVLFNLVEYYALIFLAQKQLTEEVLQRIEANSDELGGNLILAIPLEFPYASSSEGYTRVDGQFVYEGKRYRMVKQKFYKSMLYVVCIKDDQEGNLNAATADYSKLFSGQHADRANTSFKMINSLSKDYISKTISIPPAVQSFRTVSKPERASLYRFTFTSSVFRPPQFS